MARRAASILIACMVLLVPTAWAQVPRSADEMRWHTFVGGPGRTPTRVTVGNEPGRIEMGPGTWSCGYARTRFAGVGSREWSVQRVLACRNGTATVSSTAWCRRENGQLHEHAATLSLGTVGQTEHITVTLSCDPPRR